MAAAKSSPRRSSCPALKKACQKRPISPKAIEDLVERIVNEVTDKYEREVPAEVIGQTGHGGLARD